MQGSRISAPSCLLRTAVKISYTTPSFASQVEWIHERLALRYALEESLVTVGWFCQCGRERKENVQRKKDSEQREYLSHIASVCFVNIVNCPALHCSLT